MTVAGQSKATQFFVERILAHATARGAPFSAAERYMLAWSESDPDFRQDPALSDAFEAETNETRFEEKVVRLIREAYAADARSDPAARERWRSAYQTLREGDHYLLVMLKAALGWRLRKWFVF